MPAIKKVFTALGLLWTISTAQTVDVSVTGTLNGQDGAALSGCDVSLSRAGLNSQSGPSGNFSLTGTVPVKFTRQTSPVVSHLNGGQLSFFIPGESSRISLALSNPMGRKIPVPLNRKFLPGFHSINLKAQVPDLESGMYVVKTEIDGKTGSHRFFVLDGNFKAAPNDVAPEINAPQKKQPVKQVPDTLNVQCTGHVTRQIILDSYTEALGTVKVYKPSVLFVSIDDLNNWIGVLGGHPQAKTPHMDGLAAKGVLFKNAYCNAPSCQPSRSSLMSGIPPHVSGIYNNNMSQNNLRARLPDAVLIPEHFSDNGYHSASAGKILHYVSDLRSWDESYPDEEDLIPFLSLPNNGSVYTYPDPRPATLTRESWMYIEFDWGSFDMDDEEFGSDYEIAKWARTQFAKDHTKPFFLATGIFRPHLPWFSPKYTYDMHPLDEIELPAGYLENDQNDLPSRGVSIANNQYHDHLTGLGMWEAGVQAYLASITYADSMLGIILNSLAESEYAQSTMVVLWSDHGWHLGEKERWRKFTLWRQSTNVPLMFYVPKGFPGLPQGTPTGGVVQSPVQLLNIYKTLVELTGIPEKTGIYGNSMVPMLKDVNHAWPHTPLIQLEERDEYAIASGDWRYIHYRNDGEELYNIVDDPWEWNNLAGVAQHATKLQELRALALEQFQK